MRKPYVKNRFFELLHNRWCKPFTFPWTVLTGHWAVTRYFQYPLVDPLKTLVLLQGIKNQDLNNTDQTPKPYSIRRIHAWVQSFMKSFRTGTRSSGPS